MLTSAVFVFTPALGKVGQVCIRGGSDCNSRRTLERPRLRSPQGIISFPSFHTSVGILFVYTARRHLWALAVLIPLNLLLIAAALPIGGHYLVDLPAGAAVAASIVATRVIQHRLPAPNRCVSSGRSLAIGPSVFEPPGYYKYGPVWPDREFCRASLSSSTAGKIRTSWSPDTFGCCWGAYHRPRAEEREQRT